MVETMVITAMMISMTSIGGELGCNLKPKTRMTNPRPPASPIPIPLNLAPTKIQPSTTANSIQNMRDSFQSRQASSLDSMWHLT